MSPARPPTNVPASVRARLGNLARQQKVEFQLVLGEFATERFLYRLGVSNHAIQHAGRPYRVLYAFDPRRCAILLLGGDKTGDARWYDVNVPVADRL